VNDYWEEIHGKSKVFPVVFIVGNFYCDSCWSLEGSGKAGVQWLNLRDL